MPMPAITVQLVNPPTSQPVAVLVRDRSTRATTLLLDVRFTYGQRIAAAIRLVGPVLIRSHACDHVATACSHAARSLPLMVGRIGSPRAAGRTDVATLEHA